MTYSSPGARAGKQFSLDSRIDLVVHSLETSHGWRNAPVNEDEDDTNDAAFMEPKMKVEAIAEDVPDREGTNGRYIYKAKSCWLILVYLALFVCRVL